MKGFPIFAAILLGLGVAPSQAPAAPVRDNSVEAELIADVTAVQPGVPFTAALRLKIDPTWHTYWRFTGQTEDGLDAGRPTGLKLTLPDGFTAGELEFPYPHRFPVDFGGYKVVGFGYETEVIHPIRITPPATLVPGLPVTLVGEASWVACDPNTCIPGKATLSLILNVSTTPAPPSPRAAVIAAARAAVPKTPGDWKAEVSARGDRLVFSIRPPDPATLPKSAEGLTFFVEKLNVLDVFAEQSAEIRDGTLELTVPRSASLQEAPSSIKGTLVSESGTFGPSLGKAVSLDATFIGELGTLSAPAPDPAPTGEPSVSASESTATAPFGGGLLGLLLGGFLGGIILNIMPCVFPVISLKVLNFVQQAGEDRRKTLIHAAVFTAGVLVFFWALTGALLGLRAGGRELGWGFQLQDPRFVVGLVVVMVLVALSLFGVFEIGTGLTGAGGSLAQASGYAGSFWTGALTVLLATPCTAPFMGPAIGFALGQPAAVSLAVFSAIGLGLALPYLLLGAFPKLLGFVPRPGPWMETFKQAMGFPMLAVAVFLIGVVSSQLDTGGIQWALSGVLGFGLAAWLIGRFSSPAHSRGNRLGVRLAALAIALVSIAAIAHSAGMRRESAAPDIAEVIQKHREAGRNVFVDFTAEWCVTCKVNERVAIRKPEVQAAFTENDIEFVVADWTNEDPRIKRILEKHGRAGVPLYLLYPADLSREPIMLREGFITPGDVLEAIRQLPK
ncbi:MAG: thioredoxin family protein [Verrucomicrobiae bacterium]|nr:thioredoxin family protein [Verrucomicrobiae bacterium]MCP5540812.1 thioredoxin family protein [Akkermansiaceae bacterium]